MLVYICVSVVFPQEDDDTTDSHLASSAEVYLCVYCLLSWPKRMMILLIHTFHQPWMCICVSFVLPQADDDTTDRHLVSSVEAFKCDI